MDLTSAPVQASLKVSVRLDLVYGPRPQQTLDIYSPISDAADRPAVVMLHGGTWKQGDKSGSMKACKAYAAAGLVAFAINYRLIDGTPETAWPAQLSDVQLAVRWIKSQARELGIDPFRVCAHGVSAGAHLAALLGTLHEIQAGDMSPLYPQVSPDVACVIDVSGPTDLAALAWRRRGGVAKLLGTTNPADLASRGAQASPLSHVNGSTAPVLIVHGISDPVVPYSQAEAFYEALKHSHVPVWFASYEGGHLLQGLPAQTRRLLKSIEIEFARHLQLHKPPRWSLPANS